MAFSILFAFFLSFVYNQEKQIAKLQQKEYSIGANIRSLLCSSFHEVIVVLQNYN